MAIKFGRPIEMRDVARRDTAAASPALDLTMRPRRNRKSEWARRMVRENVLTTNDLIWPLFVTGGHNHRAPVASMPGVDRLSVDQTVREAERAMKLNIPCIALFPYTEPSLRDELGSEALNPDNLVCQSVRVIKKEFPELKDEEATGAWEEDGIVQLALRALKPRFPELVLLTDVCLCEYTSHGHCGVVVDGDVDNDRSLELLARTAVSHVEAGADVVAPSDMMDGRVGAIRESLDDHGFETTPILAYSAKYASAFYGPFREAADSAPSFGDRRGYQMDPANVREALRECKIDLAEGADAIMIQPALPYLDVIRAARDAFQAPLAAYNVSGEYAMVKAAARAGWLDERAAALESLTAIKRAGADLIVSYWTRDLPAWL